MVGGFCGHLLLEAPKLIFLDLTPFLPWASVAGTACLYFRNSTLWAGSLSNLSAAALSEPFAHALPEMFEAFLP